MADNSPDSGPVLVSTVNTATIADLNPLNFHLQVSSSIQSTIPPVLNFKLLRLSQRILLLLEVSLQTTKLQRPTSEKSVSQSSASSAFSSQSKSSHSITSFSDEPTFPLPTTSTTSTTSKSSADTVKVHHILRSALAVYTVTFTLFLLPIPKMNPLEFILITTTCITGWILLYFDTLVTFLQDPHQQVASFTKSFEIGLLNYIIERWYTFQLIRRRNQPHTTLRYPPPVSSVGRRLVYVLEFGGNPISFQISKNIICESTSITRHHQTSLLKNIVLQQLSPITIQMIFSHPMKISILPLLQQNLNFQSIVVLLSLNLFLLKH